ncbi:MAG TPA: hypothetical protein ENJ42_07295 [Hellea balneolensis]|uniref:Peptidase S24/S26A/S26B/S26C domain-containing protein n=1 Tax=Hellea balneolensis TaxID=287478 RepID=A0A7C5R187_9PROT|nr:hypothetical protein [Hellea balneolensis]
MRLIRVSGESMSPTLRDGDIILVKRIKPRSLRPGYIYVIQHSDLGQIIKRLDDFQDNRCLFSGDNPNSTPSAVIAPVDKHRVQERALLRIGPRGIHLL